MKRVTWMIVGVSCLALIVGSLAGCPLFRPQKAQVTVLLAGDALKAAALDALKADEVPVADMESLTVTVTKVVLDYAGTAEPEPEVEDVVKQAGEGEGEGEGEKITVFEGTMDLNLLDLMDVSAILSSAEIPAGFYTKIRLSISNPRLVLKADPSVEITDIHLTANARLFVSETFELPAGPNLIQVDFGGVHLVQTGNGKYVFTPQLRADVSVTSAAVQVQGVVASVSGDQLTVTLADGSETTVNIASAVITLANGTVGTAADLAAGLNVTVDGIVDLEGAVTATAVTIVVPAV